VFFFNFNVNQFDICWHFLSVVLSDHHHQLQVTAGKDSGLRQMEVLVTTGATRRGKFQSNRHHQQTNPKLFYMPDALPVAHPTVLLFYLGIVVQLH